MTVIPFPSAAPRLSADPATTMAALDVATAATDPEDRRRFLVRAAALVIAEIERMDLATGVPVAFEMGPFS